MSPRLDNKSHIFFIADCSSDDEDEDVFLCDDGSTCIPIAFLCDGDNDCGGWEDEAAECADGKSLLVATGSETRWRAEET